MKVVSSDIRTNKWGTVENNFGWCKLSSDSVHYLRKFDQIQQLVCITKLIYFLKKEDEEPWVLGKRENVLALSNPCMFRGPCDLIHLIPVCSHWKVDVDGLRLLSAPLDAIGHFPKGL